MVEHNKSQAEQAAATDAGRPTVRREFKEVIAMVEHNKSAEQAAATQELLDTYGQATQHWLDRMKSEMTLWADLGPTLAKTRSTPEAFDAYGKCVSQQIKMTTEDTQHLLNDWQRMTQKITQSLGNGMWPKGIS